MIEKVLITDDVHPKLIDDLTDLNVDVDYFPDITLSEVLKIIAEYQGVVINSKIRVDQDFLDRAVELRFVARLGSGMEIVDLKAAKAKGIQVFNSPEGNCNAVAEHAIGMLLALANNLVRANQEVKHNIWEREKNRGFEIGGKTVGIIGFGHTGSSLARKLSGFDTRILAFDKYLPNLPTGFDFVEKVDLETIQMESDILSFHVPLTAETRHMGNNAFFHKFSKPFILINTSRGAVIQTEDLIENLNNNKILFAGLDVFENEKPNSFTAKEIEMYKALYDNENVLVSPHIAGWTTESKYKLSAIISKQIRGYFFDKKCTLDDKHAFLSLIIVFIFLTLRFILI